MSTASRVAQLDRVLSARLGSAAWLVTALGAVLTVVSTFLPWTYDSSFAGDLTLYAYPGGPQVWVLVLGVITAAGALLARSSRNTMRLAGASGAARGAALVAAVLCVLTAVQATVVLGGTANVSLGLWLAVIGSLLALAASRALAPAPVPVVRAGSGSPLAAVAVVVLVAVGLVVAAALLDASDSVLFIDLALFAVGIVVVARRLGVAGWLAAASQRYRLLTVLAVFLAALAFPLTQGGSDANMSIAVQVLVFVAAALGLNIVIGYAGLLDLGYVAFVGAGAYTAAVLSGSAFATAGWSPPFALTALIGLGVSALLGVIIGLPTLRLRGDYLAIVTLAFGEIFHIAVGNLDGANGPDVTNGPNGIPGVPPFNWFGFDFGRTHKLFGVNLAPFSNYYVLLLLLIAAIVFVVTRVSDSRIGRAWVAIREDETAAEAMGINTYRLKLLAFAGGALLAGLGGTIKAHADQAVVPDSYVFEQSSFLVAAIVLGGMGSVPGVILGSTLIILLPEKLRFFSDYRLLLFGLTLVLVMRFRPEGLLPSRRRARELHNDEPEQPLAAGVPLVDDVGPDEGLGRPGPVTAGGPL